MDAEKIEQQYAEALEAMGKAERNAWRLGYSKYNPELELWDHDVPFSSPLLRVSYATGLFDAKTDMKIKGAAAQS